MKKDGRVITTRLSTLHVNAVPSIGSERRFRLIPISYLHIIINVVYFTMINLLILPYLLIRFIGFGRSQVTYTSHTICF